MITEKCSHCGNIVEGTFTPSDTRKILTSIAKKGGMKALMAYVGWVIPGLGNVAGFATGAVLDLVYGDDIKKLIDKIADALDKKKIYAFSCPRCGYSWTWATKDSNEYSNEELCEDPDELTSVVEERIIEIEACLDLAKKYSILSDDFKKYALVGLGLAKEMGTILTDIIDEKRSELSKELVDELIDMEWAVRDPASSFLSFIVENCRGRMNSPITPSKADYSKPFSMEVYGVYPQIFSPGLMLVGVVRTGVVRQGYEITLPNNEVVSVSYINMFGESGLPQAEAGDLCTLSLNGAKSYFGDFGDKRFIIGEAGDNSSTDFTTYDPHRGSSSVKSSQLTSDEEEYITEYKACLEEGGNISDRERRLLDRIRKSLGISEARARELEASCSVSSLTEKEQEYADEIRTCLEDSGSISARERRLLNKLRISLGISESRALEIEALVK